IQWISWTHFFRRSGRRSIWNVSARHRMSGLPPKADIRTDDQDVRLVPKADSCTAIKKLPAGLRFLCVRPHELAAALQALGRPDCVEIIEFRNRPNARR